MYMYTTFIIDGAQLNLVGAGFFRFIVFYKETYVFFAFIDILTSTIESYVKQRWKSWVSAEYSQNCRAKILQIKQRINWHHRIIVYIRKERTMNHNILVSYVLATRGTQYKSKLQPPVLTNTWTHIIHAFSLQIKCGGGTTTKNIWNNHSLIVSDFIWSQKFSAHLIFHRKSRNITFHYTHLIKMDKNIYASHLESSALISLLILKDLQYIGLF